MNAATFCNSRFSKAGFHWGAAAPQTCHIPGAAPFGSLAPWRAAPSKLLAIWVLRTQSCAHWSCPSKPLRWLLFADNFSSFNLHW